jgi:DNA processing protein
LPSAQQQILEVMGFDPISPEAIQQRTSMDLATLATHLLELELAGNIALSQSGHYQRITAD